MNDACRSISFVRQILIFTIYIGGQNEGIFVKRPALQSSWRHEGIKKCVFLLLLLLVHIRCTPLKYERCCWDTWKAKNFFRRFVMVKCFSETRPWKLCVRMIIFSCKLALREVRHDEARRRTILFFKDLTASTSLPCHREVIRDRFVKVLYLIV